jgi:hypothetical protein
MTQKCICCDGIIDGRNFPVEEKGLRFCSVQCKVMFRNGNMLITRIDSNTLAKLANYRSEISKETTIPIKTGGNAKRSLAKAIRARVFIKTGSKGPNSALSALVSGASRSGTARRRFYKVALVRQGGTGVCREARTSLENHLPAPLRISSPNQQKDYYGFSKTIKRSH